jgi:hypothetical protein
MREFNYSATHAVDHLLIMGSHNNCGPCAVDAVEKAHNAIGRIRVKVSGGLICKKNQGTVYKRSRYRDSLLLST